MNIINTRKIVRYFKVILILLFEHRRSMWTFLRLQDPKFLSHASLSLWKFMKIET